MSEQKHSKEPWNFNEKNGLWSDIHGSDGWIVASVCDYKNGEANARRIVAAVNACAGIPTDMLETSPHGFFMGGKAMAAISKQRDELLAALDVALENLRPHGDNCFVSDNYEGDPGSRCNCGIDGITDYLIATIASVKANTK